MLRKETLPPPRKNALAPIRDLRGINEMDEILRSVVRGGRKEVRAAIDEVLKLWPGRERREIWARLRCLRNGHPKTYRRHTVWKEEDIEVLQVYYAQGRAGAYRAVQELIARHPDWTPRSIWYKASKLGISTRPEKTRPWSKEEEGKLLWDAGEKPLRMITRKLRRSEAAVRQKLSSNGAKAKVRMPREYNLHRVSRLLGVSDTIVRVWFRKGLFGRPNNQTNHKTDSRSKVGIRSQVLEAFCEEHPEKINEAKCDRLVLAWLEEKGKRPAAWQRRRGKFVLRKEHIPKAVEECEPVGVILPGGRQ